MEADGWMIDDVDTDVVVGPEGWLDDYVDSWVAFRVSEGALVVERLDVPPSTAPDRATAVRSCMASSATS